MVGDVRFAGERNAHDFLSLVVIKGLEDETMEVFDVDWSAAGVGGGLSGTFGQGVSWATVAGRGVACERASNAIGYASWGRARG